MMNIYIKFEQFIEYQEKYGTVYLDKKNKYRLNSNSKKKLIENIFGVKINEMLDGTETEYDLFKENDNYKIIFKTKTNNEYRFDLFKEPNKNIFHLGFSKSDIEQDKYNDLTQLNESIEIFSKLSFILKDLNDKLNIDEYCIGATGDNKKDRIYKYFMKYVKSFEKRYNQYYDLGWALYFKI